MHRVLYLLILLPLVGCQKETTPINKKMPKNKIITEKITPKKDVAMMEKSGDIEEAEYKLSFNVPENVKMNEGFQFNVTALSKGQYHINKEYPFSVKIKKGNHVFGKDRFKKGDVKHLDDNRLEFDIKGICNQKGNHKLDGVFTFGYCTETLCATAKQKFTFNINVQ